MIFEKIKEVLVDNLDVEESELTLETNLLEDLDADSLDLFQLVSDLEDEYDIKIENIEEIKTIGDVVEIIEKQQ